MNEKLVEQMINNIVELFGQSRLDALGRVLRQQSGFQNKSQQEIQEWICGYLMSSYADLCEEFGVELT